MARTLLKDVGRPRIGRAPTFGATKAGGDLFVNLIQGIQKESARVRQLLVAYEGIGPAGTLINDTALSS